MAEIYSFFDPILTESGLPDREYNAQEFTDYFGDLVTTGIMKGKAAELKVTANGSNMITEIDTGVAFVEGKRYANTAKLTHTHDTETLGKDRIDRIVIKKDLNTDARHVKSFIKKGVPSANPVPPALTQTKMVYEISLAQVKVIGGQTYINANDIIDERANAALAGWAGSNILPNFNDAELADLVDKVDKMYPLVQPHGTMNLLTDGGNVNQALESGFYLAGATLGTLGNLPTNVGAYLIMTFNLDSAHSPGTVMQIAFQTTKSLTGVKGTWQRLYAGSTGIWQPWVSIANEGTYDTLNLNTLSGWSQPWTGACRAVRSGDVITIFGFARPLSNSSNEYIMNVPAPYRLTTNIIAAGAMVPLTNGTWVAGQVSMEGDGSVKLVSHTATQVSKTLDTAFALTYVMPR